ncbi:type IV pilus modification protein PilV [Guyparkeria hydrothermalis]|uniref:type IV pilus modification protein PilV n=1 Tax=Guyparkeria hydrothermalis TaxID=923 RepID=UPI002020B4F5|nr:type IV pilus modification protein PilV [Guyparkeria hydrothermalis]MCL7745065.1 type IV pilus modification protein PilV [Guyparkeria hydrothermalis]
MKNIHSIQRQSGVGLIEILIAVLVLSIGFLGIAALQSKALSNNNSSMNRSIAIVASYSMLDALRADPDNAVNGNYNGVVTVGSCPDGGGSLVNEQKRAWCTGSGALQYAVPPGPGDAAPPDGLAALGDGVTGEIQCSATGLCTVTVTFDDEKATGGEAQQQVVTRARL